MLLFLVLNLILGFLRLRRNGSAGCRNNSRCLLTDILCRLLVNKVAVVKLYSRISSELIKVKKHFGSGLISVLYVLLHGSERYLLKTHRNLKIYFSRVNSLILKLHDCNGNRAVRLKRKLTRYHLVENNTDRVDIRLIICYLTACLLRTDVMHGADGTLCHRSCFAS